MLQNLNILSMKLIPICRHRKNPETAVSFDVVYQHYLDE